VRISKGNPHNSWYVGGISVLLYRFVDGVFNAYIVMLIVAIVSSWFPEIQEFKAIKFIRFYTDPYLNFFRRIIPPLGMLDVSPILAFIALQIVEAIVKGILFS
jgi:YggT family protein